MTQLIFLVLAPLILSNSLHMLVVKQNWLAGINIPVAAAVFGANKTWRAFLVLPFLNAVFSGVLYSVSGYGSFWSGAIVGAVLAQAYLLPELPNSYLKRQMGVAAGQSGPSWAFILLDKSDSAFGVALASAFIFQLQALQAISLFFISVCTHFLFSWLLLNLGIKKNF